MAVLQIINLLLLVVGSAVVVCAQYRKPQWDLAIRPWADKATAHGRYIGRRCRMVAVYFFAAEKPTVCLNGGWFPSGNYDTRRAGGYPCPRPPVRGLSGRYAVVPFSLRTKVADGSQTSRLSTAFFR
jgi:hypothetical protein